MRMFIFCADPREEADLLRKITKFLLAPDEKPLLLSFLGGPICLAYPQYLKSDVFWLMEQIRFAKRTFPDFADIILVGHDCGYYANVPVLADEKTQKNDLVRAANFLESQMLALNISACYDCDNDVETPFEEVVSAETLVVY